MSLEITGKLLFIGERVQVTEKFAKRIFTVETKAGQYPEFVALQFVQDRTNLIDPFAVGQEVRVHFNAKSREYNGNYYTELTAWGIALALAQPVAVNQPYATDSNSAGMVANAAPQAAGTMGAAAGEGAVDDLPF